MDINFFVFEKNNFCMVKIDTTNTYYKDVMFLFVIFDFHYYSTDKMKSFYVLIFFLTVIIDYQQL
jgi:hypothetical protein